MRKFALIPSACAVLLLFLFATFAHAQQVDVAVGAGILLSTRNISASQAFLPPAEKGGLYPSFSFDRIFKDHFGYSAELATSYKYVLYNNYQQYRPIFYDVNAVYAPRVGRRTSADLTAGVGGERILFYSPYGSCNYAAGCNTNLNANHLLFQVGADIRYAAWRHFFVRPEAHLYHIVNNSEFHSDNVFRVGGSIGYTFGRK